VGRAGRHVEGSRKQKEFRSRFGHFLRKLRKTHVVADGQSHPAEFRIKNRNVISCRQGFRFPEMLPAFHGNVKKMHFPVSGNLHSAAVKYIGCIIDSSLPVLFRHAARRQNQAVFFRVSRHPLPGGAAFLFRILRKCFRLIRAKKHFRKHGKIRSLHRSFCKIKLRCLQILFAVSGSFHLNQGQFHFSVPYDDFNFHAVRILEQEVPERKLLNMGRFCQHLHSGRPDVCISPVEVIDSDAEMAVNSFCETGIISIRTFKLIADQFQLRRIGEPVIRQLMISHVDLTQIGKTERLSVEFSARFDILHIDRDMIHSRNIHGSLRSFF